MDLEALKRCWRDDTESLAPSLAEETVARMLIDRTRDLRRRVRRRLRREAGYYVPIVAVPAMSLLSGFTPNRMLAAAALAAMLGGIMATLWWAEQRIEDVPLDRSLREALRDLEAKVDSAGRAYLAVYVGLFAVSSAILAGVVWWRSGAGWPFAAVAIAGALAVPWSYRSGRAYVARMFHRDRVELSECLQQLEERA